MQNYRGGVSPGVFRKLFLTKRFTCIPLFLTASMVFCISCKSVAQPDDYTDLEHGQSMRTLWQVTDFTMLPGASMSKDEAASEIFTSMDMRESWIRYGTKVCKDIDIATQNVALRSYLQSWHPEAHARLELQHDEAKRYTTNCMLDGLGDFLRLPNGNLLILKRGVIFTLHLNYH